MTELKTKLKELEHENSMLWKTLKEERRQKEMLKAEVLLLKKLLEKTVYKDFKNLEKQITAFIGLTQTQREASYD